MRVLVRPCYDVGLQNRLFGEDSRAGHLSEPWAVLRKEAKACGIDLDTWDLGNITDADVVWVQDLPPRRQVVEDARRRAPKAKFVLHLYELPLDRIHFYDPRNHDLFDAIVTFNHQVCDERRYFRYCLPLGRPPEPPDLAFSERRPMALMNTNKHTSFLAAREGGPTGVPFFGPRLGGWKVNWVKLLKQRREDLTPRRRNIARLAEKYSSPLIDVWGGGWQGEPTSWSHRFFKPRSYKCARGRAAGKIDTLSQYRFCLAFENIACDMGYVSEKIIDCFFAGVVPIYLGDARIEDVFTTDSFIDARQFKHDAQLLEFVRDCPETLWQKYHDAVVATRHSDSVKPFLTSAFVDRILQVLLRFA